MAPLALQLLPLARQLLYVVDGVNYETKALMPTCPVADARFDVLGCWR
jgi:hypothetical protein